MRPNIAPLKTISLKQPQQHVASTFTSNGTRPFLTLKRSLKCSKEPISFKRTTPLSLLRKKGAPRLVNRDDVLASLRFKELFKELAAIDSNTKDASIVDNENSTTTATPVHKVPVKFNVMMEDKATNTIIRLSENIEMNTLKCRIGALEKEVAELMLANSRIKIENDLKETKLKSDFDAKCRLFNRMAVDLTTAKQNEQRISAQLEQYEQEYLRQVATFEAVQLQYERTINELRGELLAAKSAHSETRSTLTTANLLLKCQVGDLELELEKAAAEKDIYYSNWVQLKAKDVQAGRLKRDLISANEEIERLSELAVVNGPFFNGEAK